MENKSTTTTSSGNKIQKYDMWKTKKMQQWDQVENKKIINDMKLRGK